MLQIKLNICIFQKTKQFKLCKGGVGGPNVPKILALPEGGGGSAPCQDFFGGFVHNVLKKLDTK